jgi:hypothetical protein
MTNRSLEGHDRAEARTVRDVLRSLRSAYDRGGIEEFHGAHAEARRRSVTYKALCGLVSLAVPVAPILDEARELDQLIGELGLCAASRGVLARLRIPWQIDMPERGAQDILSAPVVFYGRRGAALTPLLLAAALDRSDLKVVAASHIAGMGANIGRYSFPVYAAARTREKGAGRRRLVPPAGARIAFLLGAAIDREDARARNRTSLVQAVDHVRHGGGLVIAPDPRERKGAWRQGIGVIVVGLAHDSGTRPAYVVPWSITNIPTTGVLQLLSPNPLVRAIGRMRFRHPVHVAFGEPVPVRRVVELAGYNPAKVAEYLERDYHDRSF